MAHIRRGLVDRAIRDYLATQTTKPIGLADVPTFADPTRPDVPYAILTPVDARPSDESSWADLNDSQDFSYQVTCVGLDHRQTAWMSDKVNQYLTGTATITMTGGYNVEWRAEWNRGPIIRTGDALFQCVDDYTLRMGY